MSYNISRWLPLVIIIILQKRYNVYRKSCFLPTVAFRRTSPVALLRLTMLEWRSQSAFNTARRFVAEVGILLKDSKRLERILLVFWSSQALLICSHLTWRFSVAAPPALHTRRWPSTSRDTFRRHLETHFCQQVFQSTSFSAFGGRIVL